MHTLRTVWRGRFSPVLALYALLLGTAFLTRIALLLRPEVQLEAGVAGVLRSSTASRSFSTRPAILRRAGSTG